LLPPELTRVTMGSRDGLGFADNSLAAELRVFEAEIAELRQQWQATSDPQEQARIAEVIRQRTEVEHPFNQLWNRLGPVSWKLCQLRVAMFGDYAIPSIFGTDKLGR